MRLHGDRHQCVSVGVVMIESACKSFAVGDGQIELELVSTAARWIWPGGVRDFRAGVAKVDPAFPFRLDTRGALEKPRKLGKCDRLLVVEAARRMTFQQKLCDRRLGLRRRSRELPQIDFFARPAGPHRRGRRYGARVWMRYANRVGVPA